MGCLLDRPVSGLLALVFSVASVTAAPAAACARARSRCTTPGRGLPVRGQDELGQLATTFNVMTRSLREVWAQLDEKVRSRTEALAAANAALEQRHRELSERQDRETAYARTLEALAAEGPLEEVLRSAMLEAKEIAGSSMLECYRCVNGQLVSLVGAGAAPWPV